MVFDADKNAKDAAAAHAARNALAHKNPAAATLVDAIKTAASAPEDTTADTAEDPASTLLKGKPERRLTTGELRLAQAYLRVMDYFGPMPEVKGISVVHGRLDARTKTAFVKFYAEHHKTYGLDSHAPTLGMLQSIIKEHDVFFREKAATIAAASPADARAALAAEQRRAQLDLAFEEHKADFGIHYAKIKTLHPEMRFPLMDALKELERFYGVKVVIAEAYRKPEKQTKHVMLGESTAPPGYSFHGSGLAMDIYPADANGKRIMNTHHPKWQKLYDVMQAHGFYSMMRDPLQQWDAPHHELIAKTGEMLWWPIGRDGWKDIPAANIPDSWKTLNDAMVQSVSAPTPPPVFLPPKKATSVPFRR